MKNPLPSGRMIFNPLAAEKDQEVKASDAQLESTSAMSHDADAQCPKCQGTMLPALAVNNIPVVFCDNCRVSNPKRV